MKKICIVVWIGILYLICIPKIGYANLLFNPGFEIEDSNVHTTGWTNEWNTNIFGTTDNPHAGNYAARNFWDGGMFQDVEVIGGTQYRLTGWVYIPSGDGGSSWSSFIGLKWLKSDRTILGEWEKNDFANEIRNQYNMGDSGWLAAPAEASIAQVRFGTWSSDPWQPVNPTDFDDFNFSIVPEPTSFFLIAVGFIGLFGLKRNLCNI